MLLLRREYRELLGEMGRRRGELGRLAGPVDHFRKVTRSYWPGLFRCYEQEGLPRTNNDLEQCFGSMRYHERRASGRKVGSPSLVVRGRVRVVASVVSRQQVLGTTELRPRDIEQWRKLRGELEYRHEARRCQARFRRDPHAYLRRLEDLLLNPSLPP